jgi:hypothetical protein
MPVIALFVDIANQGLVGFAHVRMNTSAWLLIADPPIECGIGRINQGSGILFTSGSDFLFRDKNEKIGIRLAGRFGAESSEPCSAGAFQHRGECQWVVLRGAGAQRDDCLRGHIPVLSARKIEWAGGCRDLPAHRDRDESRPKHKRNRHRDPFLSRIGIHQHYCKYRAESRNALTNS